MVLYVWLWMLQLFQNNDIGDRYCIHYSNMFYDKIIYVPKCKTWVRLFTTKHNKAPQKHYTDWKIFCHGFFLFGVIYDHKIKIKYWFVYIQLDTTFYSTKAKTLKQTSLLQRMLFLFLSNILALSEPDDGNAKKLLHYINNIKTK